MVGLNCAASISRRPADSRVATTPLRRRAVAEPRPEVADVAEQEDRRQVMQQVRHRTQTVDQLFTRRDDLRQGPGSHREPRRRRLHLLLGQLDFARADVLERPHLDLLEADDLLGHQHLALLGQTSPAAPSARRCRIQTPLALIASVK